MRRNQNTVTTNHVNGSHPSRVGLKSDRVGSKADSVAIRRNLYNSYNHRTKCFPSKKLFRAGRMEHKKASRNRCHYYPRHRTWENKDQYDGSSKSMLARHRWNNMRLLYNFMVRSNYWHPTVCRCSSRTPSERRRVHDLMASNQWKTFDSSIQTKLRLLLTNSSLRSHKGAFHQQIEQAMRTIHQSDLIIYLGDFNTVTGISELHAEHVIGPYESDTPNDNTERLLNFCSGADLGVGGSWFELKDIHRYTWFSNDGVTVKDIDHILVDTKWTTLQNWRIYRSLEFDIDYRSVITKLSLRLKYINEKKSQTLLYNVKKLEDPAVQSQYTVNMSNCFAGLTIEETSNWDRLKETLNDVATRQLGICKQVRKPWVNDTTLTLVKKKRQSRLLNKHDK